MTPFQKSVYRATMRVPKGSVTTYGRIAKSIGSLGAARAVGNVLNKNIDTVHIPCHRVVCANGKVGGYVHGQREKIRKLRHEGVVIKKGRVDESHIIDV
ncbi:MAG TPA: cysteine methyltransferase [Candidatus Magasanikbacteria bacterium]|nr:cysteine methyltransferase [Candidatus Magasanikbacteria bacterium]